MTCYAKSSIDARYVTDSSPETTSRFGVHASFSRLITDIRNIGRISFCGNNLGGMKVIVVENEDGREDWQMEQMAGQFKLTDCEIFYSTYQSALSTLKKFSYKFDAIIVVTAKQTFETKKLIAHIVKDIMDANAKPIPYAIACGNIGFNREQFVNHRNRYICPVGI